MGKLKTDKRQERITKFLRNCRFVKQCVIKAPIDNVFSWHARPGALERLSPPWDPLEVTCQTGGIQPGARVEMRLRAGPLPLKIRWVAEHGRYEHNRLFEDRQLKGPFDHWIHTHRFSSAGEGACLLEDEIEYALPFQLMGSFLGRTLIRKKLERIFRFRHSVTRLDIADHMRFRRGPLTLLVTGSGGVLGSALTPFLTGGGHRIIRMVRTKAAAGKDAFFWDPLSEEIDLEPIGRIDAVIHLAGENIGQGRWSPEKKKKILESRVRGTTLLARALARLPDPPEALICASAIGYYGNRGTARMTEQSTVGSDFISRVCRRWEQSTALAAEKGIRTVLLRIGVALSPSGGALQKFLLPFQIGLGGKLGSGAQYVSWIHMDDVLGAIYHLLERRDIHGPVNLVAPDPVTNQIFVQTLGRVLTRPCFFSVPEPVIRIMFGEMGREIPLSSTRVTPARLLETGYRFRYPVLEGALRHLLGRINP